MPEKLHWSTLRAFTSPPPAALVEAVKKAGDTIRAFNAATSGKPVELTTVPEPAPPQGPVESTDGARLADLLRWKLGQPWFTWPVEFRGADGQVVESPDAVDWEGFSELDARVGELHRTGEVVRRMADALRAPVPSQR